MADVNSVTCFGGVRTVRNHRFITASRLGCSVPSLSFEELFIVHNPIRHRWTSIYTRLQFPSPVFPVSGRCLQSVCSTPVINYITFFAVCLLAAHMSTSYTPSLIMIPNCDTQRERPRGFSDPLRLVEHCSSPLDPPSAQLPLGERIC